MPEVSSKPAPKHTYYDGEIVEKGGLRFRVNFPFDEDHEEPWNDGDGQGIVSEWTTRDKRSGERVLSSDRSSKRYFDWKGTIAKAKQEGWGLCDEDKATLAVKLQRMPTPGDITAASVESNFEWMRKWCNDQWHYCGIVITRLPDEEDDDRENDYIHACWGFDDSDDAYLATEVDSMIDEYVAEIETEREKAAAEARAEELAEMERAQAQEKERAELTAIAMQIAMFLYIHDAQDVLVLDHIRLSAAAGVTIDPRSFPPSAQAYWVDRTENKGE